MPQGTDRVHRRVTGRKEVHLDGLILPGGGAHLPCVVRNISPMGANLEFASDVVLPPAFRLQIPADLFDVECALRKRDGNLVDVEFMSSRAEAMARYG